VGRKGGAYGNAERRTRPAATRQCSGEARSDLWQMMELKRFTTDELWPAQILTDNPNYRGKTLFDVCSATARWTGLPLPKSHRVRNREAKAFGFYVQKACSRNTPNSAESRTRPGPFSTPSRGAGTAMARVDGKETKWRYREGLDPTSSRARASTSTVTGRTQGGSLLCPTTAGRISRQGIRRLARHRRVLEHWHSGSMTMRVPDLQRRFGARSSSCRGRLRQRHQSGRRGRIVSRRGEIRKDTKGRNRMPRGVVFVPGSTPASSSTR
jgi:nitrate reductase NapA